MYAKGKGSGVPSDGQAREKLALYVYEYLLHVGAQKSAQTFLSEIRWEKNITLGEPPGFLHSWWWGAAPPNALSSCCPPLQPPVGVPGSQPLLPSAMDPAARSQGHPGMGGPMQRMNPPRGMAGMGPQSYGSGMRPPPSSLAGPGMPTMNMGPGGRGPWPNPNANSIAYSSSSPGNYVVSVGVHSWGGGAAVTL
ncbi:single-stranded DNA-binding protein 4 [Passer montanus]|uniref:single-stranded DNA-binding protein 4 n=1 Tax=Passer montanus TaxID=9160 RepID=UPI00195F26F4|nr:single-stranded DNA-binding protein 4 [Passer montanus]